MECFIKKIFQDNVDEQVHSQFVRFGKGTYMGRGILSIWKTSKVKLKGSFEYANDFVSLVLELGDVKFSGVLMSKEPLSLDNGKKKKGLFVYEVSELNSSIIKELKDKVYVMLLDAEEEGIKLKIKKKLPKPGKSGEKKIDDKFCQLEADLKFYPQIKETFFWDIPEAKKIKASHTYEITGLKMPENEKDFEKIRLLTKRIGKIIRKLEVDGKEIIKEKELEA